MANQRTIDAVIARIEAQSNPSLTEDEGPILDVEGGLDPTHGPALGPAQLAAQAMTRFDRYSRR